MLNRIVIINSELYGKADILIGDSTSIQLEADSNVGKSSLINTLNFLYIPEREKKKKRYCSAGVIFDYKRNE